MNPDTHEPAELTRCFRFPTNLLPAHDWCMSLEEWFQNVACAEAFELGRALAVVNS